jgi:hypothetical protein
MFRRISEPVKRTFLKVYFGLDPRRSEGSDLIAGIQEVEKSKSRSRFHLPDFCEWAVAGKSTNLLDELMALAFSQHTYIGY